MNTTTSQALRLIGSIAFAASVAGSPIPIFADSGYGIDVVNADLALAVNLLAKSTGRDIVLDGGVTHTNITIAFQRRTPDDAIRFFARTQGLVIEHYDNADILVNEKDAALKAPDQLETRVISLKNAIPSAVMTAISSLEGNVTFAPDESTKTLIVRGPAAQIASLQPIINALDQPSFGQKIQSRTFNYGSGKPSDAVSAIKPSLNGSTGDQIIPNDAAGTIVGIGSSNYLAKVATLLGNYDQYGRQVLYDVRIVELTPYTDSALLGFNTNGFGSASSSSGSGSSSSSSSSGTTGTALAAGSFGYGFASKAIKIFSQLDALLEHGTATVISDPQILAQNNATETLNATEQYPIITSNVSNGVTTGQVAYEPIGLVLKVTPTIASDGSVLTTINASYSAILGFTSGYPIIGQRQTDGTFRIGDGETLVLSGLMQDSDSNTIDKLPGLGNIPLIGAFFRHQNETKSKTELVFILTPHIKSPVLKGSDVPMPFTVPPPVKESPVDHQTVLPGVGNQH